MTTFFTYLLKSSSVLFLSLQVVLLTDGMDTRPYRLSWPTSTMIFDISPDRVFNTAAQKLEGLPFFSILVTSFFWHLDVADVNS